jgi:hypothetical protein
MYRARNLVFESNIEQLESYQEILLSGAPVPKLQDVFDVNQASSNCQEIGELVKVMQTNFNAKIKA